MVEILLRGRGTENLEDRQNKQEIDRKERKDIKTGRKDLGETEGLES